MASLFAAKKDALSEDKGFFFLKGMLLSKLHVFFSSFFGLREE